MRDQRHRSRGVGELQQIGGGGVLAGRIEPARVNKARIAHPEFHGTRVHACSKFCEVGSNAFDERATRIIGGADQHRGQCRAGGDLLACFQAKPRRWKTLAA